MKHLFVILSLFVILARPAAGNTLTLHWQTDGPGICPLPTTVTIVEPVVGALVAPVTPALM